MVYKTVEYLDDKKAACSAVKRVERTAERKVAMRVALTADTTAARSGKQSVDLMAAS